MVSHATIGVTRLKDEQGGILVLVALMLPVLLLFGALVIDVGNWWVHKRHLQLQVDAAALAGGSKFGDCFSPDSAISSAANTAIQDEATKYAGVTGSLYNGQVDNGAGRTDLLINSKTFSVGGPASDDTEIGGPCQTPRLMLDVKETEKNVPYLLGGLLPGGSGLLPAVNARARVQLKKVQILAGTLPLAVPDVNPKAVSVTFVNEATGASLGAFPLTKGAPSGGLNMWSGNAAVTLPTIPASGATTDGIRIGARISVGGVGGDCTGVAGGVGFVCYDNSATATGLVAVRDYPSRTGTLTAPVVQAVWAVSRASCSLGTGSPFFSETTLAGATSCPMDLFVRLSAGAATGTLKATINGVTRTLVAPASPGGDWTNAGGTPFTLPADGGPYDVDLNWDCPSGCGSKGITFPSVTRVYSGTPDSSGPVQTLYLSEAGSSIYSAPEGAHTFSVTVGLKGSLDLSTTAQTTLLRLTGGSRTSAIACDGSGASTFRDAIQFGCTTPYQLNDAGVCPDPLPPSGPADCIRLETGTMTGPTEQGLDRRYAACPPDNWPSYAESDPRIVKLMVTDFSALDGSGSTTVPVVNFAAFYITGWDGSKCGTNQPWPFAGSSSQGDIWGHFIKYIAPDPSSGGTAVCDAASITPCVPVLVK